MKGVFVLATFQILWYLIDANTFTNPINPHGPDPWMQYYNGYYYYAATTGSAQIIMRKAKRLGDIQSAQDQVVFTLNSSTGCCHMWAPEFHLINSTNGLRWYFYYTAGENVSDYIPTQRIHVLESNGTDPMGPYTFKAHLKDPKDDSSLEVDPSILQLNGKLYLLGTYNRDKLQSTYIRPMSNPWTPSGPKVTLSKPIYDWEKHGFALNEAAEVLQHNGKTFIIYSASDCNTPDYALGMLTFNGTDPLNSTHWIKSAQPVFHRQDSNNVYATGHCGFFTSPDGTENWMVYHANNHSSPGCDQNRSSRAQKITWNTDGTPNFGIPVALGVSVQSPSGES